MKRKKISAKNQNYNADVHVLKNRVLISNTFCEKFLSLLIPLLNFIPCYVIIWLKMSSQVHRSSIKIIDVDRPAEFEFLRSRSNRLIRDLFKKNYLCYLYSEPSYLVSIVKLFPNSAATHNLFVNLKNPKYWLGY